jgi:quercetin dioxygenase-like cupin family protein
MSLELVKNNIHRMDTLASMMRKEIPDKIFECEFDSYFIPGVYVRTMHIPKGVVAVGKIHNYELITIIISGELELAGEGGDPIILSAGMVFKSPAGVKRAAYIFEDAFIATIHKCDSDNVNDAEDYLVSQTYEDYVKKIGMLS